MFSSADVAGVHQRKSQAQSVTPRSRRSTGYFGRQLADSPWRNGDLARLLLWQALGVTVIVVAWFVCSGEAKFHDQVGMIAVGVLAVVVASVGAAMFLFTGLAAVGRERLALRQEIAARYGLTPASVRGGAGKTQIVTGAGMRRYHASNCDVVMGKQTRPIAAGEAAELEPCGMCRP